ncbi:pantothenate synthetase [Granulicella pectinivorans]|uniref:Pantothenate synthetase n=1 Tax=Granulicella pectinivorans TaxID=474950 RepID=A0A1I6L8R9_9BACT|nr:pantoate--beta-alanine ligase [Granulicella pectinivorans]SFR99856.1 pantothenate synthetase [Granulicella pectinivorans]
MQIHTTIAAMQKASAATRRSGQTLGFVPTMGAIHQGHLSLVRAARAQCDVVAASIFVNPLQFAPTEDLDRYPRPFEQDVALLRSEGVEHLFAPTPQEMYPAGATTFVEVAGLSERLDGASRPGHFRGVATVVSKLFHIVQPTAAFFGQKDAAQLAVLRALVRDQNFPIRIIGCPIVREPDGLAMSSRNRFLSPSERAAALTLSRALHDVAVLPNATPDRLRTFLIEAIRQAPSLRLDYAEIVDPETLLPAQDLNRPTLVAIAAWSGATRLIDNAILAPVTNVAAEEPELCHHV